MFCQLAGVNMGLDTAASTGKERTKPEIFADMLRNREFTRAREFYAEHSDDIITRGELNLTGRDVISEIITRGGSHNLKRAAALARHFTQEGAEWQQYLPHPYNDMIY